ncbi:biotin-dependent carboxyltransferase family protein [Nocardioides daphniae]|uniref:5-oxoprolinase subunit C family protein n=1 Tax=Nocardioides daphniae TaxID=402297 RepID=UPI001E377C3E|nr:biotin-dependent carboxyltransferase family protein [Nocardioides daphniae]
MLHAGPLATVQDLGRPGLAKIGVGASGAADRGAFTLANRLVGNPEDAAGIEVTVGGFSASPTEDLVMAVTGAPVPVWVDERREGCNAVLRVRAGQTIRLGVASSGVRSYLGVRGGIAVPAVLGSRSTDMMAHLGPAVLEDGVRLPVGAAPTTCPTVDQAVTRGATGGRLRVIMGPRDDWFTAESRRALVTEPWTATAVGDRIGIRLDGPVLQRAVSRELSSEGLVRGALQVPPRGHPTLMLSDHPVTGGYPVIAVVVDADIDRAANMRPGDTLFFEETRKQDLT